MSQNPLTDVTSFMPRNKKIVELFQKLSDSYLLEEMQEEERNIFILEFLRVFQLRLKQKLDLTKPDLVQEKVFEEELEFFVNEMIKNGD